jgi:hypothetical protein
MTRRVHIEHLDLDLRGLDPALAEAAVRALGPALQQQLAASRGPWRSAAAIDAGHVPADHDAVALARGMAQRIAARVTPGTKD